MGHRALCVGSLAVRRVVAALVAALLVVPLTALGQSSDVLYLDDTGVPKAGLSSMAPGGSLGNLDASRDTNPGLFLEPTAGGAGEVDASMYQVWSTTHNAIALDGLVTLVLSASTAGTETDSGRLNAYLLDCPGNLRDCTVIESASVMRSPWGTAWRTVSLDFGAVAYELGSGRKLAVKVVVDDASSAGMHVAYAAAAHPSRLTVTQVDPTTTTSPASTTSTTPATTSAPTTTTTPASNPPPPPTSTTTSTTTASQSTSTTVAPGAAPGTTTTTRAVWTVPPTTVATGYPGSGNVLPPTTGSGGGTATATTATTVAPALPDLPAVADRAEVDGSLSERLDALPPSAALRSADDVLAMVVDTPQPSVNVEAITEPVDGEPVVSEAVGRSAVANVVEAVELVLPDRAARVAVSPLLVADALVDLLVRTGQGLSVPAAAAGVVVGMLVIGIDRRGPEEAL